MKNNNYSRDIKGEVNFGKHFMYTYKYNKTIPRASLYFNHKSHNSLNLNFQGRIK